MTSWPRGDDDAEEEEELDYVEVESGAAKIEGAWV